MTTYEKKDMEERMIWYQKAFGSPNDINAPLNTFDSIQYVYQALDRMNDKEVEMYVCERQNTCTCKGNCLCDSDEYFQVQDLRIEMGSNNSFICQVTFPEKTKLSRTHNLRFFTLHQKTDQETPVLDIQNVIKKRSKRKVVESVSICFPTSQPRVNFPVFSGVRINNQSISFSFNYMLYDKFEDES